MPRNSPGVCLNKVPATKDHFFCSRMILCCPFKELPKVGRVGTVMQIKQIIIVEWISRIVLVLLELTLRNIYFIPFDNEIFILYILINIH